MRIRIALTTAVAVTLIPTLFFTLFSSSSAASAGARHTAAGRAVHVRMNPMSDVQALRTARAQRAAQAAAQAAQAAQAQQAAQAAQAAQQAAKLTAYANAVTAAQKAKYIQTVIFLQDLAFFNAVAQQQAAKAAAAQQAAAQQAAVAALPASAPGGGSDATSTNTPDWACIRAHESGDNYAEGGGGAYQFEFGTWHGLTGLPLPAQDYPASVQDSAALKLFAERGWEPWTTRYVCGL